MISTATVDKKKMVRAHLEPDHQDLLTWALLSVQVFHNSDNYEHGDQRHLFVTSTSIALQTLRDETWTGLHPLEIADRAQNRGSFTDLLSCMVRAVRWSLEHQQPNCGAYCSLPWVKNLISCFEKTGTKEWRSRLVYRLEMAAPTVDENLWSTFLLVLRLLEACLDRELLTGLTDRTDFTELLSLVGNPVLPDLPSDLPLAAVDGEPSGIVGNTVDEDVTDFSDDGDEVTIRLR